MVAQPIYFDSTFCLIATVQKCIYVHLIVKKFPTKVSFPQHLLFNSNDNEMEMTFQTFMGKKKLTDGLLLA